eukprot:CAMPEP_0177771870 /NCGR_PEP_ID=MMETSP0491_2-20121128/11873_1 /TAXON_ID=63592 /ORGANISM="Tetraselmis chuii, Strain PLY429" /LENGTH=414 /DNA_ID=CAMNT_0019289549 /DNA_START=74 /DNA_END=1318 /DNA_ORIENTATION=-
MLRRGVTSLLNRAASSAVRVSPQPPTAVLATNTARAFATGTDELKKTALWDFHVAAGGKMVDFAGWSMPIQYKDSIMESTQWCRDNASLFDVSHMCGVSFKGKDAIKFMHTIVVGDISAMADGTGGYSLITNEKGGIVDDTVVTRVTEDNIYIVVNAGCAEKDLAHFNKYLAPFKAAGNDVTMEIHSDRSLLALQGPAAKDVLQGLTKSDLSALYFSMFDSIDIGGVPVWITRTGYTGEDGFEISIPVDRTLELAEQICASDRVRLCGLGARDSLRLEAGLCLYGNDLNDDITPIEAGLTWTIPKARRAECAFNGGEVIKKQIAEGVDVRRVGFVTSGAPARAHSEIKNLEGEVIGEMTSGGFSPCLKKNIAMGYVKVGSHKSGTELKVVVRGKENNATVTKMPFVTTTYYRPT